MECQLIINTQNARRTGYSGWRVLQDTAETIMESVTIKSLALRHGASQVL
jgi:hypothetical protein